jgi:GNAT superfamily N-acetyltransferase
MTMTGTEYRELALTECDRIREIDPDQYIKNAFRLVGGRRVLVEIDYYQRGWPEGYEKSRKGLERVLQKGGVAFGAFDSGGRLLAYASLSREVFGAQKKYVLLDALFVSKEVRGRGIGGRLFHQCVHRARDWQVDCLYICAGSAEDTIGFYRGLGCKDTPEINEALFQEDPRDIQLAYSI